jgi:hypothetical protein
MTREGKETYEEMANEVYKEKIKAINNNLFNKIDENYISMYWYLYLKEKIYLG